MWQWRSAWGWRVWISPYKGSLSCSIRYCVEQITLKSQYSALGCPLPHQLENLALADSLHTTQINKWAGRVSSTPSRGSEGSPGGKQSGVHRGTTKQAWGSLSPSCGTDRQCHWENKQTDPRGCGRVWLVPGLSPLPSDPTVFVEPAMLSSKASIFLACGASGPSCLGLIYKRKSSVGDQEALLAHFFKPLHSHGNWGEGMGTVVWQTLEVWELYSGWDDIPTFLPS